MLPLRVLEDLIDRHLRARLKILHDTWPDDLLSRLLRLHRGDARMWPLRAVRDECMTTLLAGHETTAATLTCWVWCMASNPVAPPHATKSCEPWAAVRQRRIRD
jgi:cytochrome P450